MLLEKKKSVWGGSSSKETEPMASKTKENAIELRQKLLAKPKVFQQKKSVSPKGSEKRCTNYQAYQTYLNQEGPQALGSKEIPSGAENCLEGFIFVITEVLESI